MRSGIAVQAWASPSAAVLLGDDLDARGGQLVPGGLLCPGPVQGGPGVPDRSLGGVPPGDAVDGRRR